MEVFTLTCILILVYPSKLFCEDMPKTESKEVLYNSLSDKVTFYSGKLLVENWKKIRDEITAECKIKLQEYVEGLEKSEPWALKIEDANGRFSRGWFWGSRYWTGSKQQCDYLSSTNGISGEEIWKEKPKIRVFRDVVRKSLQSKRVLHPVMSLEYYRLVINLNVSFLEEDREIVLGICLPDACENDDVINLVQRTAESNTAISIKIKDVKSHHNYYYFYTDSVFIFIGVSTGIIIALSLLVSICENIPRINNDFVEKPLLNDSFLKNIMLPFSVRNNVQILFQSNEKNIYIFHIIRISCVSVVISVHSFLDFNYYSENSYYKELVAKDHLTYHLLENLTYVVDAFFFMSGFLASFQYFNKIFRNRKNGKEPHKGLFKRCSQGFKLIVNRYIRLSVPYFFVLIAVKIVMKWFHYNSVFQPLFKDFSNCEKYWWRNVLYINTWYPFQDMCMLWSWYLSNDAQFFVVGTFLIIIAVHNFKTSVFLTTSMLVISWVGTGYLAHTNNFLQHVNGPLDNFNNMYDKPWIRIGPYLIGTSVGWFLSKSKGDIKLSKRTLVVGWMISIFCGLFMIFSGFRKMEIPYEIGILYTALSRSFCALNLAWIVIALSSNRTERTEKRPQTKQLFTDSLIAISRLSYCAYLVHPIPIRFTTMFMEGPLYTTTEIMLSLFLSHLIVSFILAFFVSILYEAPTIGILRLFETRLLRKVQDVETVNSTYL